MNSVSPFAVLLAVLACPAFAQSGPSHGGAGGPAGHAGTPSHSGAGVGAGRPAPPMRATPLIPTPPVFQRPYGMPARPGPVGSEPVHRPGMVRFGSPGTQGFRNPERAPYVRTPYGGLRHGPTGGGKDRDHDRDGARDHRRGRGHDSWGGYGRSYGYGVVGWPGYYSTYLWPPLFGYSDNYGSSWDPDNYTGPIPEYGAQPAYPQVEDGAAGSEVSGSPGQFGPVQNGASSESANAMPGGDQTTHATRQAYTGSHASDNTAVFTPQHTVTVVFKDGRPSQQIHNYLLTRSTLTVLDQKYREIPLNEIDVPATEEANRADGVDFKVPAGTK